MTALINAYWRIRGPRGLGFTGWLCWHRGHSVGNWRSNGVVIAHCETCKRTWTP